MHDILSRRWPRGPHHSSPSPESTLPTAPRDPLSWPIPSVSSVVGERRIGRRAERALPRAPLEGWCRPYDPPRRPPVPHFRSLPRHLHSPLQIVKPHDAVAERKGGARDANAIDVGLRRSSRRRASGFR